MAKHAAAVTAVTKLVAQDDLYDPARHDELWMLRFVLSHAKGGVPAAARAAREHAVARFSNFKVGAALETPAGTIITSTIIAPTS